MPHLARPFRSLPQALLLLALLAPLATPAWAAKDPLEEALKRSKPVPATEQIPAVDFFRPARFFRPRLNPAGTVFAALFATEEDRTDLMTFTLETRKRAVASGGEARGSVYDINNFEWIDDSHLLFSVSRDKRYATGLFSAEINHLDKVNTLVRNGVVSLLATPRADRTHPLIWLRKDGSAEGEDTGVSQIDATKSVIAQDRHVSLRAPVLKEFPHPPEGVATSYLADKDGALAFATSSTKGVSTLWRLKDEKSWVKCPVDLEHWNILAPGDTPGEVIAAPDYLRGEASQIVRLNAITGETTSVLHSDPNYSLARASVLRRGPDRRIVGVAYHQQHPQIVWFDDKYRDLQKGIGTALRGMLTHIESSDEAEKYFIISARSDTTPTIYHWLDQTKGSLSRLAESRPWINPERMRPMGHRTYVTRDGLRIDAYLTLPEGASKEKPAPLVVYPHGGPFVRDTWGWHPVVQFLASRGYAVLQPNYRGSSGYDWSLVERDPLVFRKMHDDVTDGVKTLIRQGLVDPDRIAIMGSSFGGYLALSGVTNEPDLYRCAVTISGVFDWEQVLKESKRWDETDDRYHFVRRRLGDPKQEKERFDEISPLRHVDHIKVPVFVAHGEDDVTAYIEESKALLAALRRHKIPHEKLLQDEEGHGFRQLEHKVALYEAIEKFLARELSPRKATAPAQPAATVSAR